jgi:hypothetical protein
MKKSNIFNVTSPTFFVNRKNPQKIVYGSKNLDLHNYKFVQVEWFGFNPKLRASDFLYIYEKDINSSGFRGVLLTPEHLKR